MDKKKSRRALGRGLSNLIPVDDEAQGSGNEIVEIDITAITPNPFQPRSDFDQEEIAALAQSIEAQGLLQPLLVRKKGRGYQLISGERRFRALGSLGRQRVPAVVRPTVSDRDMLEIALVENIQRRQLNELETALAYTRLLQECGLSHEELARQVGRSRSAITNSLRLLKLPQAVRELLVDRKISGGHARSLLAFEDDHTRETMAKRIVEEGLSVRQVEQAATRRPPKGAKRRVKPVARTDPDQRALIEKLEYRFGTKVTMSAATRGQGKFEIRFFSEDDCRRIADILLGQE